MSVHSSQTCSTGELRAGLVGEGVGIFLRKYQEVFKFA